MNNEMLLDARRELTQKSAAQIEGETAYKWAARAAAAYQYYISTGDVRWRLNASKYHDEACEHASLAHDGTLDLVRDWMSGYIPPDGV